MEQDKNPGCKYCVYLKTVERYSYESRCSHPTRISYLKSAYLGRFKSYDSIEEHNKDLQCVLYCERFSFTYKTMKWVSNAWRNYAS